MARDPETLSDDTAAAVLALLRDFRRQVIEALLMTPAQFQQVHKQRLQEIDGLIQEFDAGMRNALRGPVQQAAEAGDEAALEQLLRANVEVPAVFVGVNPSLIQAAAEYQADLITDLGNYARGQITKEVRRVALGNTPITDLITKIGVNLEDRSIFKNIRDRAEAIARTEVSRVYSMAHYEQSQDIADRYEDVTKTWIHAGFGLNSRANHVALDGVTIPFDEEFNLGKGVTAPYPHHPSLPAGEVVHCRCRVIINLPTVT